jgi:hypothetical protein
VSEDTYGTDQTFGSDPVSQPFSTKQQVITFLSVTRIEAFSTEKRSRKCKIFQILKKPGCITESGGVLLVGKQHKASNKIFKIREAAPRAGTN